MQDVAYQEEIAVPDATGEEAIIPVENAMLDAENLPLDVRRNSPRHLQPPLGYGDYMCMLTTCLGRMQEAGWGSYVRTGHIINTLVSWSSTLQCRFILQCRFKV